MKAEHPNTIAGLSGRELGKTMVDLRFDTMADILGYLSDELRRESSRDEKKGRKRIALELRLAATGLREVAERLDNAWDIAKQYTDTDIEFDLLGTKSS